VLLHVGPFKTGTTAIQTLLSGARDNLEAHGVTYPGSRHTHHAEARALLPRPARWKNGSGPAFPLDGWERLVETVGQLPGRVVLSSEYFSFYDEERCGRVVDSLGADRLHVLIAARNPGSIALSNWQQVLKDARTRGLEEWLEERFRRTKPEIATSGFWSWADPATLVDRWRHVLDPDRIRVVVISEQDRTLLARTFEDLLALPAGVLSGRNPPRTNRSFTAPEAELFRRTLELTQDRLRWDEFTTLFHTGFANRLLDHRTPPANEARSVLPEWAVRQAAVEAASIAERLTASGVRMIGDLGDLMSVPPGGEQVPIHDVPVDLAAEALAGVIIAAQRQFWRDRTRAAALAPSAPDPVSATPPVDALSASQLFAALAAELRRRMRPRARSH
jgi:hypothetical protein